MVGKRKGAAMKIIEVVTVVIPTGPVGTYSGAIETARR
jgi:hypothetical protein